MSTTDSEPRTRLDLKTISLLRRVSLHAEITVAAVASVDDDPFGWASTPLVEELRDRLSAALEQGESSPDDGE